MSAADDYQKKMQAWKDYNAAHYNVHALTATDPHGHQHTNVVFSSEHPDDEVRYMVTGTGLTNVQGIWLDGYGIWENNGEYPPIHITDNALWFAAKDRCTMLHQLTSTTLAFNFGNLPDPVDLPVEVQPLPA